MKRTSHWIHRLMAISPLDGRYWKDAQVLAPFVSEFGLTKYRLMVEVEYLIAFVVHPEIPLRPFTAGQKRWLRSLYLDLTLKQAEVIKAIETQGYRGMPKTNHDVNSVVRYMIYRMQKHKSLRNYVNWVHFALTSEDINNIAYALMLSDALQKVVLPTLNRVQDAISKLASMYAEVPMLARTHGQPASPTTLGKEFNNFASRLFRQSGHLLVRPILAKLNGASGNYNAHVAAFPKVDWRQFSEDFILDFNSGRQIQLQVNSVTTQIEPHDTLAELFDNLKRIDTILIDFCQDMWRYISDEWIVQKAVAGEDGSSAMPQKVNPIQLENSEGNDQLSVALFEFLARTLPISRLQRHLSDSTIERNFGVALGHTLVAYNSILRGLDRMAPNPSKIVEDLERKPEVISEAFQIIMRREGVAGAYDQLKDLTRGKPVTTKVLHNFVRKLRVKNSVKRELRVITPQNYIGIAAVLAQKTAWSTRAVRLNFGSRFLFAR